MLVIDELKKSDPQLRLVAVMLAGGLLLLVVGLWWVQVVSTQEYEGHLKTQAYRTIRVPAPGEKSWIAKAGCWRKTGRATT